MLVFPASVVCHQTRYISLCSHTVYTLLGTWEKINLLLGCTFFGETNESMTLCCNETCIYSMSTPIYTVYVTPYSNHCVSPLQCSLSKSRWLSYKKFCFLFFHTYHTRFNLPTSSLHVTLPYFSFCSSSLQSSTILLYGVQTFQNANVLQGGDGYLKQYSFALHFLYHAYKIKTFIHVFFLHNTNRIKSCQT